MMLILTLLGVVKNDIEWAVFPGLAVVIGLFFHTAFLADGDLTQVSGGSTVVIASASTAVTSVWQALQWLPAFMTIAAGLIVAYQVGRAFK